jgi:dihydroxy-acid dehydratase
VKKKLRSNFEAGTSRWAVRRAQWRALGLTVADMEKPKIAIVNTSSELSSCFSHLDAVSARLKEAIRAAGGLPFEIRTAAPSDFVTSAGRAGRYILPSRDLLVNDIEVQVEGALLDGMVCLASCDKTTPGQLMAAGRLNIPSLVIVCGYQPHGEIAGREVDIEEVFESVGKVATGEISVQDLTAMTDHAVRGPGVCAGMGTANSMHIACEALGMALPGTAPVLANSPKMFDAVARAGKRIVEMVWEDLKPRDIMTGEAFSNAVMVALAVSGSINLVRHLQAIAVEAECEVDIYKLYNDLGTKIPLLAAVRPNGSTRIEALEAAGGTLAVMKRLEPHLHRDVMTVSGKTVSELLASAEVLDNEVIRPLDAPLSTAPALVIVHGNIASEGALIKLGVATEKKLKFVGKANVYHSTEAATAGLRNGEIKPGQVVVLRGMGAKGGPGLSLASPFVAALDGAGLSADVAVVTDGQLSGLNRGLAVGQIMPEAAEGGGIALVESGDTIQIDVESRAVNVLVSDEILAQRRAKLTAFVSADERGWLSIYQRTVQPLTRGAVLITPRAKP